VTKAIDKVIKKEGAIYRIVVNVGRTKYKPALDFTTKEIK